MRPRDVPVAGTSPPPADAARRAGRRRSALLTIIVALVLLAVGAATYREVRRHVIESISDRLVTFQSSQEAAVRLWKQNERASVSGWAYEPDLRASVLALTAADQDGTDTHDAARGHIRDSLQGLLTAENARGYLIADRLGRVIASSHPEGVGRDLAPGGIALLRRVLTGRSAVTMPFVVSDFFYEDVDILDRSVVVKAAPVHDAAGDTVAALVVAIDATEFSELLDLGRFGETGETYAVGADGWMLSRTRTGDQLREFGLIPPSPDATSVFAFQVRDPGGDMTRGFRPDRPRAALPLTLATASVTQGNTGIALDGYRDFRGVRVIGAWRWLDDLELGLITEIEYREAMAPLRPLVVAFAGLFGLAALAAGGVLAYARIVERLRRRIREVTHLGPYTLLEKIGEGGMGRVYRARHALLARDTAVKLLKPDVVSDDTIQRFEREVQLTARLRHPNTIEIYDYGRTPEGLFYYAMEYLEGYDLGRLLELSGPLPADRVVHILRQACRSLREAHAAGLIHRDIKPMNLIVSAVAGEYDVVKVLDFGLVKDVRLPDRETTALNVIPGTPPYIAPERLRQDAEIDGRVDVYALGAVAFNLLTGDQVFDGDTALDIAYKAMHEDPPSPSACGDQTIPPALDALVHAALARSPEDRPADIDALLARLDRIAETLPWDGAAAAAWWDEHPPPARPGDARADFPRTAPA